MLTEEQLDRLAHYVDLLRHWQRYLNLTGLREVERLMDVLVVESLDFLQGDLLPRPARVLDLGTGAGVPGIALAVGEPRLGLTLLDRSRKKMTFLRRTVLQLHLSNCRVVTDSAEAFSRALVPDDRFDVVVSRGVGRVAHLLDLAAPLLRSNGMLVLRKPANTSELEDANEMLISGVWGEVRTLSLPLPDTLHESHWMLLAISRRSSDASLG